MDGNPTIIGAGDAAPNQPSDVVDVRRAWLEELAPSKRPELPSLAEVDRGTILVVSARLCDAVVADAAEHAHQAMFDLKAGLASVLQVGRDELDAVGPDRAVRAREVDARQRDLSLIGVLAEEHHRAIDGSFGPRSHFHAGAFAAQRDRALRDAMRALKRAACRDVAASAGAAARPSPATATLVQAIAAWWPRQELSSDVVGVLAADGRFDAELQARGEQLGVPAELFAAPGRLGDDLLTAIDAGTTEAVQDAFVALLAQVCTDAGVPVRGARDLADVVGERIDRIAGAMANDQARDLGNGQ
ncbi:MAG: hypothetical protein H6747_09025 [Deltaproteobacteria bacterium]|nr:hypothetical protein [Deltaproteobacteria bacterium]